MRNRWDDREAATCGDDLDLRVYTSRLLGTDPELVLHGGGNTSVKAVGTDVFGDEQPILWVKGSGWDLASIERAGFAPVHLETLRRLVTLDSLPDTAMARELRTATLDPAAPSPSVEALLHAVLPHRFVDHTHADAVVALTNTPDGEALAREVYGDRVVVVPYVMPGFDLAKACARLFAEQAHAGTVGMVLAKHGIFSFGDSARESYDRMIALVGLAEEAIGERGAPWPEVTPAVGHGRAGTVTVTGAGEGEGEGEGTGTREGAGEGAARRLEVARLRAEVSERAGHAMVLTTVPDAATDAFARHPQAATRSQGGPATPDHVIRTKRVPLVGRDVEAYAEAYRAYFERHAGRAAQPLTMLDPAPRVVLDADLGALVAGRTPAEARIAGDILRHTVRVVTAAERLGGYTALSEEQIFDVEYWDLEQAKLARQGAPPPFAGQVALVTGGAGGIGAACGRALLTEGAAVTSLDLDQRVTDVASTPAYLGVRADVREGTAIEQALDQAVSRFGGLDVLILNAGAVPQSTAVAELDDATWDAAMGLNLDSNLRLLRLAHPLLAASPSGGRVVVIGSKNVAAPGPGMAAYSASKAALTQLARVTALEWAADGIRVNVVHPDAVFDTGLWTPAVLEERARRYGLTVEEYKRRNLLGVEITSADVAALAVALCGPAFSRTTGAQIPVDGGNDRVV